MAVAGDSGVTGSCRGVSDTLVRGYESLRHTCQEGYDYAKGYSTGEADTRCLGRCGMGMTGGEWWTVFSLSLEALVVGILMVGSLSIGRRCSHRRIMMQGLELSNGVCGVRTGRGLF